MNGSSEWLSAHLYHPGSFDVLLLRGVGPLVEALIDCEAIDGFFFVRYWDGGPHIRLRLKGNRERLDKVAGPRLHDHFSLYPNRASFTPDQLGVKREDQSPITVVTAQYVPEVERYGGHHGIAIAERQFEASSRAVLGFLEASCTYDYSCSIGMALQMHLSLVRSFAMSQEEASRLFRHLAREELAYAYPPYAGQMPTHPSLTETVLAAFQRGFRAARSDLVPRLRTIWDTPSPEKPAQGQWFVTWDRSMRKIGEELREAHLQGLLNTPTAHSARCDTFAEDVRGILSSYIHMTNNRLGVLNRDEPFVAFMLARGIEEF